MSERKKQQEGERDACLAPCKGRLRGFEQTAESWRILGGQQRSYACKISGGQQPQPDF